MHQDNGLFAGKAFQPWAGSEGNTDRLYTLPGKSIDDAFIQSFHGRRNNAFNLPFFSSDAPCKVHYAVTRSLSPAQRACPRKED
jgi:hypothetical protein